MGLPNTFFEYKNQKLKFLNNTYKQGKNEYIEEAMNMS